MVVDEAGDSALPGLVDLTHLEGLVRDGVEELGDVPIAVFSTN